VAEQGEGREHFNAEGVLDVDGSVGRLFVHRDSRRVDRGLGVHASVDQIEHHLGLSLGLVPAAHDAVAGEEAAVVAGDHRGHDRVIGPLAAGKDVGVLGIVDDEARATVLQAESALARDDAAAEALVVRVDERAGVAVAVGG